MKTIIESDKAPAAIGPYSQAILTEPGKLLFVSGQIPVIRETGVFAGETIEAQTRQCILNLQAILEKSGGTLGNIVKTTVFLADINDFTAMNAVYSEFFTSECPARSTIGVAALPKNAMVEIEAIAMI